MLDHFADGYVRNLSEEEYNIGNYIGAGEKWWKKTSGSGSRNAKKDSDQWEIYTIWSGVI